MKDLLEQLYSGEAYSHKIENAFALQENCGVEAFLR